MVGLQELDARTLGQAQRGVRSAQSALIRCYQDPVYALVSRTLMSRSDLVDDVAQETFLKVLKALDRFSLEGRAKLSTWILTIAVRTAIDALRRSPPVAQVLEHPDLGPGPEGAAEAAWLARRVRNALTQLSAEQRAVLALRAFHDLDYPQIAEVLGVSVGTVKSRLSRAREALKGAL